MEIIFKSKNFSLTPSTQDYVEKKIESLKKFLKKFNQEIMKAEVELGRTTYHHKSGDVFRAEINLSIDGKLIRAEAERDDIFVAIDEVRDDLEQEIRKLKTKRNTIFIRGARSIAKKIRVSSMARFKK